MDYEPDDELWKAIIQWVAILLKRNHAQEIPEFISKIENHNRKEVKTMLETNISRFLAFKAEEGRKEGRKESIIRLLNIKFGILDNSIKENLNLISDEENLDILLEKAFVAKNINEFKLNLDKIQR